MAQVEINDIIDTVNELAVKALPELRQVDINISGKDFKRPALLIEQTDTDQVDVNKSTVKRTVLLSLTYFGELDDRALSDVGELNTAQRKIMDIFAKGYIRVGGRALKCSRSKGSTGFSDTVVDVLFDFFDERGQAAPVVQVAKKVTTKIKIRRVNYGTS